ncbi:MAG: hypothetical protein FWE04_00030 [Oscillospiraceae bacterium]|nr:hypothetical protein [Oscillospiraceae bacterium]
MYDTNDNILYRYIKRTNLNLAVFCVVLVPIILGFWLFAMPYWREVLRDLPPFRFNFWFDNRVHIDGLADVLWVDVNLSTRDTMLYLGYYLSVILFSFLPLWWLDSVVRLVKRLLRFEAHPVFGKIEKKGRLDDLLKELRWGGKEEGRTVTTENWIFERKLFKVYVAKRTKLTERIGPISAIFKD